MKKSTTTETENDQFTKQYAKIAPDQHNLGPWEHQQPLKPRPKTIPVNDPNMSS